MRVGQKGWVPLDSVLIQTCVQLVEGQADLPLQKLPLTRAMLAQARSLLSSASAESLECWPTMVSRVWFPATAEMAPLQGCGLFVPLFTMGCGNVGHCSRAVSGRHPTTQWLAISNLAEFLIFMDSLIISSLAIESARGQRGGVNSDIKALPL